MNGYLSLDMGTTNIKAAAFDENWALRGFASLPTPVSEPRPGWGEFDPLALWETAAACIRKVAGGLEGLRLRSIGVSSMAEAGVPLNREGTPLYPVIAWYDPRAGAQYEALEKSLGKRRLYDISGQVPSAKYGLSKLLWIRDHHPEVYEKTAHWLSVPDWLHYRLTGRMVTDYSIAARTMAFDIRRLEWSGEILEAAGIDKGLFPRAVPGGTAVGGLLPEVARALGLPEDIMAVTGGHDHACAAIGVGILEEGVVLDSMGTAEASMIAVARPPGGEELLAQGLSAYPHCGGKLYRVHGSIQSCGATVEWLLALLGKERDDPARFEVFSPAEKRAGNGGLYCFPFLRGSIEGRGMKGAFIGIGDRHLAGDFADSLMDGLCYEFRRQLNAYQSACGHPCAKLRVVGGLSVSADLMQRKADVLRAVVETPVLTEAACLGAALLGAVGVGDCVPDRLPAYRAGRRYEPADDPRQQRRYVFYLRLREQVRALYDLYEAETM